MARFIAALVDPPVAVPAELVVLLDTTILLRQSYSDNFAETPADTADKDSDSRHAFFLGILKNARSVLDPLISRAPAATKKPKSIDEIFNMFEHLKLEDPYAAFVKEPDATPILAPIYKAERPNDIKKDFFAFHLLLHNLARLRTEVSYDLAGYKQGGHDLIAASVTTNTTV